MKSSFLLFSAAVIGSAFVASPALAEEKDGQGWYGTAGIGFVAPNNPTGDECQMILASNVCVDYDFSFDTGLSGEIGVGYDFGQFRIEGTYVRNNTSMNNISTDGSVDNVKYATFSTDVNDGNANLNSFMVNGYIDFDTKSKFVPYLGGGIGYTNVNFSSYNVKVSGYEVESGEGSANTFGYQAKAGISYLASDNIDIFGEATFFGTTGFSIETANVDGVTSWGARGGVRYRF